MRPEDIDSVAHLFDLYRQFYKQSPDLSAAKAFLQDRFNKGESIVLVAVIDERIAGFTQLYPLFSSVRMKPVYLLNDLFTESEHRNKGIGARLINFAKELAIQKGFAGIALETEKSNASGNHLYPKLNFELDTAHNYYSWTPK